MAKRGGFPGGMPGNMNNLMKQAQRMQRQMEEQQKELEEKEFTASVGGGVVKVTVSGKREVTNVELAVKLDIAPSYMSKFKTDARRPNVYQIDKIAQILGTTTDYLLGNNVADLPFYTNFQRDEKQSTSLMNGLRSDRNFALFNQWNTIKNIEKELMITIITKKM